MYRDVEGLELPQAVSDAEWIFLRAGEDQSVGLASLVDALETDLDWRDRHTRLAGRAREWLDARRDNSYLLRGSDLREAEAWLAQQEGHREAPTAEQGEYIARSRRAAGRRQRTLIGGLSVGLAVAIALAVFALIQRSQAIDNQKAAQSEADASASQLQLSLNPGLAVADGLAERSKRASRRKLISCCGGRSRKISSAACLRRSTLLR